MPEQDPKPTRRDALRGGIRGACLLGLGGGVGFLATRSRAGDLVWQLDPELCIQCGNCATYCVLQPSAVKCVQYYPMCGYCDLCTGYFDADPVALDTAAENQLCPVDAIERKFIEEPYFEYDILEDKCVGCGKCVEGCRAFGNGSFYLQVRHNLCLNCNECGIAAACPSQAFRRVPVSRPYIHPKGHPGRRPEDDQQP